jgi:L-threonylcarbamoyladenylate synthase
MKITLQTAFELLHAGEVIGFPTDTVYGIAADFQKESAVDMLYELKGRDYSKPIILLAASIEQIQPLVTLGLDSIQSDLNLYWPGAVTVILPANKLKVISLVRGGGESIGVRIPNHQLALEILEKTGPLAVTSANFSGEPPAWNADQVEQIFGNDFPVVDGGESTHKEPSKIYKYTEKGWERVR